MLSCYFDASYDSPPTVTVVSGWIASTAAWERFDTDWRILLARYEVPYFHMREFAHSVGPFASWKGEENKRANFLRNAVDIIRACALHGFACLVEHAPFNSVNAQYYLSEWVGTPYALAGGTASHMPISGFERTHVDSMSITSSRLETPTLASCKGCC